MHRDPIDLVLFVGICSVATAALLQIWLRGKAKTSAKLWQTLMIAIVASITTVLATPVTTRPPESWARTACLNNVKQVGLGLLEYVTDFDNRLPPANVWATASMPYTKNEQIFHCPEAHSPYSYALNKGVAGVDFESVQNADECVATFEADINSVDSFGGPNLITQSPRHNHLNYGLLDGSYRFATRPLQWLPHLKGIHN